MLEVNQLECTRGERVLFRGLDLALGSSTLAHVVGPNGAGKTSLLRILCGLLPPTRGTIRWRGAPVADLGETYRGALAYVGHANGVKDDLTARENLRTLAACGGLSATETEIGASLAAVGLGGFEDDLARTLSQGQRRRVALARLFLSRGRPLWLLDEPFVALDPRGIGALVALMAAHLAAGNLVVLTTHQDVAVPAPKAVRIDLSAGGRVC